MEVRINLQNNRRSFWSKHRTALKVNLALLVVTIIAFFFLSPRMSSVFLYRTLLINWGYLGIILLGGLMIWPVRRDLNKRRGLIVAITAVTLATLGCWGFERFREYLTYQTFAKFEQREDLVATNPKNIRYSPRHPAYIDMENLITAATEDLDLEHTWPLITKDGFYYVSPIVPDGVYPTFFGDNPGYVIYDDRANAPKKVDRIDLPQRIGLEEQWFDGLWWNVYNTDWSATYEDPHFIALDDTKPHELVAVVPKIEYAYWLLPYWAGILIIHPDGTIEDLNVDEARADPRLTGKWIAPMDLTRKYIELQNYRVGYWESFFRVEGKLEIPELPGENQFPFLTGGADGNTYFVTATKAEGGGGGLFRMYYVNAFDGALTYYEFDKADPVFGPDKALNRVQNLEGFNWYRATSSGVSGNHIAVEPVYVFPPGHKELSWKFTVTNKDYSGTAGTVVVNGKDADKMQKFDSREAFDRWQDGKEAAPTILPIATEQKEIPGEGIVLTAEQAKQLRHHLSEIDKLLQK